MKKRCKLRSRNSPYLAEQLRVEFLQLIIQALIGLLKAPLLSVFVAVRYTVRSRTTITAATAQDAAH